MGVVHSSPDTYFIQEVKQLEDQKKEVKDKESKKEIEIKLKLKRLEQQLAWSKLVSQLRTQLYNGCCML